MSAAIRRPHTTPFTWSSDVNYAELRALAGTVTADNDHESARDGMRGRDRGGRTNSSSFASPRRTTTRSGMQRRRLAAGVVAAVTVALLVLPGVAAGAQADEQ